MKIKFAKMHGLGNDFMVINAINQQIELSAHQIQSLANRYTGVGFDQLLIVAPASNENVDFDYIIYNADGSASGQCGNGARCFALFVQENGLSSNQELVVQTNSGVMRTRMLDNNHVSVHMGLANFEPQDIPLKANVSAKQLQSQPYQLTTDENIYSASIVSVGNPHAVLKVNNINDIPLQTWGEDLQHSKYFPQQVNLGCIQIVDESTIKLRVYERGSGETLACGSGACAAVVAARLHHGLAADIKVIMCGGSLEINYADINSEIIMTGEACYVYDGIVEI